MGRRWLLLAGLSAGLCPGLWAQTLAVRLNGDRLHVSEPQLRFLTGKPLERLRDGASVTFVFQLSLFAERKTAPLARVMEGFLISYDLWEEKFSVIRSGPSPRSVSHLSSTAAEAWCLDNLSLPVSSLAADRPFWIRLDFDAEDPKEQAAPGENSGLSLTRLIDIFSRRRSRDEQSRGFREAGPLRLADLKKNH